MTLHFHVYEIMSRLVVPYTFRLCLFIGSERNSESIRHEIVEFYIEHKEMPEILDSLFLATILACRL